ATSGSVPISPTCPPPSVPWATITSAPASMARSASSTRDTMCITRAPTSCAIQKKCRRSCSGHGQAKEATAGRAASSVATRASSPRNSSRFSPNGRSVSARIAATSASSCCAFWRVAPSTPSPPAFETAATSAGEVPLPIPPSTTGCSIPNSSQIRVRSIAHPRRSSLVGSIDVPVGPGRRQRRLPPQPRGARRLVRCAPAAPARSARLPSLPPSEYNHTMDATAPPVWDDFEGVNQAYLEELYERLQRDPSALDPELRAALARLGPPPAPSAAPAAPPPPPPAAGPPIHPPPGA